MTSSSSRPSIAADPFVTPDLIGGLILVIAGYDRQSHHRHTRLDSVIPNQIGHLNN